MMIDVWQEWMLALIAVPLIGRTLFWAIEMLWLFYQARGVDLIERFTRRSVLPEWESRVMTAAVAVAAVTLGLGHDRVASFILLLWMATRWMRFAKRPRAGLLGLVAMSLVSGLASGLVMAGVR